MQHYVLDFLTGVILRDVAILESIIVALYFCLVLWGFGVFLFVVVFLFFCSRGCPPCYTLPPALIDMV